jgi:hypothetical protein
MYLAPHDLEIVDIIVNIVCVRKQNTTGGMSMTAWLGAGHGGGEV